MLSLPAFRLSEPQGLVLQYNTESYVFELEDFETLPQGLALGSHFRFDIPSVELEFEALKSNIDKS